MKEAAMTIIASQLLFLLTSYGLASVAIAAVFSRAGFPTRRPALNLLAAFPLGPIVLALLLWGALKAFPGCQPATYLVIVLALPLAIVTGLRREAGAALAAFTRACVKAGHAALKAAWHDKILGLIGLMGLVLLLLTIMATLFTPPLASDPLEYLAVSRVIFADKSLIHYPIDVALENGLYSRPAHPPAYHLMVVWTYFIQGDDRSSFLLRFIQLHYVLSAFAVLVYASIRALKERYGGLPAAFMGLSLLTIPHYFSLAVSLHVDVMRTVLFALALFMTGELCTWLNARKAAPDLIRIAFVPALLTGLVVGLGMFAHSIGLLLLPFAGLIYLLLARIPFKPFIVIGCVLALTICALGLTQFLENILRFGVPLHDAEPVWDLPVVDNAADLRYRRELVTWDRRLLGGLLGWFTSLSLFGPVQWLALVFIAIAPKGTGDKRSSALLVAILAFYAVAALSMAAGSDLIIKNFRYLMTIVLPLAFFAGQTLSLLYKRARHAV